MQPARPIYPPGIIRVPNSVEEFRQETSLKIEVIETLCSALRNYLCFDLDVALRDTSETVTQLNPTPVPTLEEFHAAQSAVDAAQANIDEMSRAMGDAQELPDNLKAWGRMACATMLQPQLDSAVRYRDHLQRLMEESEAKQ